LRKLLVGLLKVGLSLAIVVYLIVQAKQDRAFAELAERPKNWPLLVLAAAICGLAVVLTHIRWCYLVRALDLPFRLSEAFRLGFLGYLFNLAPTGIVGGDVLKGVMLGRHHRGSRAKVLASVLVDRLLGLYVLFVMASVAILTTRFWRLDPQIHSICMATLLLTVVGAMGLMLLFVPGFTGGWLTHQLRRAGRIGHYSEQALLAVRIYKHRPRTLLLATLMSFAVQSLFVFGAYFIAMGLFEHVPSLDAHFVVVPLSSSMGVVPLPFGPFELVLEFLYVHAGMPPHQGLIVALGYRLVTVLIAVVGVFYFLAGRREVVESIHAAEDPPQESQTDLSLAEKN